MRRASSAVFSHLQPYSKTPLSLFSRDFIAQISSLSSSSTAATTNELNHNHPSSTHLKICSKTHGVLPSNIKTHQFLTNPSQNFNTLVDQPSQIPSKPRNIEERSSKLQEEDTPESIKDTEANFDEREEGIDDLRKCLEKEMALGENSTKLGKVYLDLSVAYVADLNYKEALTYCLKALEIHLKAPKNMGHNSLDVAGNRRILEIIYNGLEEYDKALEQNYLRQEIFKTWGLKDDLIRAEIDAAHVKIGLRKYDEAINKLNSVVMQTDKLSKDRAMVFVPMAKALCHLGKFLDAKRCLDDACGILSNKEEIPTLEIARTYMEMSQQYKTMKEYETAISLLKRAYAMLEKFPQDLQCSVGLGIVSKRMGLLLLLTGEVEQAVPCLEDAAERLKEGNGSKDSGVGYVYCNLGGAYLKLGRPQSAAKAFALAKDVLDVSLGPHHIDSIEACQGLSIAYDAMGSYTLALDIQEKVIEALEGLGLKEQNELKRVRQRLEQLKKKAQSASSV